MRLCKQWHRQILRRFIKPAAELGRNPPVSKHQIQPEYGDEQADAGRDCRTRLARPNSQARTHGEILIVPVQLTTCRTGNLTRLMHTIAICVTIHTILHIASNLDRLGWFSPTHNQRSHQQSGQITLQPVLIK